MYFDESDGNKPAVCFNSREFSIGNNTKLSYNIMNNDH